MPTALSVTLQMPRGNLETIFPRALVLSGIRRSIAAKEYRTAFMACRTQRVDMNILHDYAPAQFMSNIALFIDQIQREDQIDLFLSQLRCFPCARRFNYCLIPLQGGGRHKDDVQRDIEG